MQPSIKGLGLALLLLAALAAPAHAELEQRSFDSRALGEARRYVVYLPPGYGAKKNRGQRYPVVYVLHGLGGAEGDFFELGKLERTLDKLIRKGRIRPLLVVAPEGRSDYWVNHAAPPVGTGQRIGDYVAVDLVGEVDARFRTVADGAHRALAGVSMGGFGAASLGLQYNDRFAAAVSLGGALFTAAPSHRRVYHAVWGDPPAPAHWRKVSPLILMRDLPVARLPRLYIQCGDHDGLGFLPFALEAHRILAARKVPHELRVSDGGHTWSVWRQHNADWLRFVDAVFRKADRRRSKKK